VWEPEIEAPCGSSSPWTPSLTQRAEAPRWAGAGEAAALRGTAYAGSDGGAGEAATGAAGVTATRATWWPMVTELRMKVPLELEGGRGGA